MDKEQSRTLEASVERPELLTGISNDEQLEQMVVVFPGHLNGLRLELPVKPVSEDAGVFRLQRVGAVFVRLAPEHRPPAQELLHRLRRISGAAHHPLARR